MTRSNPRIVVYSCYFGYPEPFNESALGDGAGYDRVLFTDRNDVAPQGVDVVHCDSRALGPARESRRAKILPHRMLEGYDRAIYVDNRARLTTPPDEIFRATGAASPGLYVFPHPERNSPQDELDTCLLLGHIRADQWQTLHDLYRDTRLPAALGLTHNAVMIHHLGNSQTEAMSELWWELFLTHSRRDQLTLQLAEHLSGTSATRLDVPLAEIAQWPVYQPAERAPVSHTRDMNKPPFWTLGGIRYRIERRQIKRFMASQKSRPPKG